MYVYIYIYSHTYMQGYIYFIKLNKTYKILLQCLNNYLKLFKYLLKINYFNYLNKLFSM